MTDKNEEKKQLTQRQKNIIYTSIFFAIVITFFVINNTNGEPEQGPYPPDYLAPAVVKHLDLADYKGKIVILDFWATWCPPCRRGIPDLIELKTKYKDKGLEIIGISVDEHSRNTKAEVIPFMKEYGINYPVVYADLNVASNYGGIRSIPTSFVVDKEGQVVSKYVGYVEGSIYEKDIQNILKGKYEVKGAAPNFKLPLAEAK